MYIINVSGELEVMNERNEENSNVAGRDKPKINFNILSAKDKIDKNDSQVFESTSNNSSLESHSESHRCDSLPALYGFDNNSSKSDILDVSTSLMLHRILLVENLIVLSEQSIQRVCESSERLYGCIFNGTDEVFEG